MPYSRPLLSMPKHKPFSSLRYTAEATGFLWKQPALWSVTLLLIALPSWLVTLCGRLTEESGPILQTGVPAFLQANDPTGYSLIFASVLLFLLTLWGVAGVMLVGRRMIGNRAGRARTSLSSVLRDSAPFVFPLFFTSILQLARILVWLLPAIAVALGLVGLAFVIRTPNSELILIVLLPLLMLVLTLPAVLYAIRTSFFSVVILAEDIHYEAALRRSREVMQGYFWPAARCLCYLTIIFVVPPLILAGLLEPFTHTSLAVMIGVDVVVNVVSSFFLTPMLLTMILLFGELRTAPRSVSI